MTGTSSQQETKTMKPSQIWLRLRHSVRAYVVSRRGAAMLIGGAFALVFMATVGASMSNYAWHEAQREELNAATRAAVSASARHLADLDVSNPGDVPDNIVEFVESAFVCGGGQGCLTNVAATIADDPTSNAKLITITGTFAPSDLWVRGNPSGNQQVGQQFSITVRANLDFERYEVALALDTSGSMNRTFVSGQSKTKMEALKEAMQAIIPAMGAPTATTPGSLMVSMVPFTSMVRVADTSANAPQSGSVPKQTRAKESYVRMLAGAVKNGAELNLAQTLAEASAAAADGNGQWVDTFHSYGVGENMGLLRSRGLPSDLLAGTDWGLQGGRHMEDISSQRPEDGDWEFDEQDFWNGCLMARWGAYWNENARPAGWVADDPDNWPATSDAPNWSPLGARLDDTPLHLSDAPPDAGDPHSLFTAYSWPDAWVGGYADSKLQMMMAWMLDKKGRIGGQWLRNTDDRSGYNHWKRVFGGGHVGCQKTPILPLTKDVAEVQSAIANLKPSVNIRSTYLNYGSIVQTYLVRGVVWGLRTLSPLWKNVWPIDDAVPRPGVSCVPGDAGGCEPLLRKSLILVTDGANYVGRFQPSRTADDFYPSIGRNWGPPWESSNDPARLSGIDPLCSHGAKTRTDNRVVGLRKYWDAWKLRDETAFNNYFKNNGEPGLLNPNTGKLDTDVAVEAVGDILKIAFNPPASDPNPDPRIGAIRGVLARLTPWELFRGEPLAAGQGFAFDKLMALNDPNNPSSPSNVEGFAGRPTQTLGHCRPTSPFGPYGGWDEQILVSSSTTSYPPVRDAAPFSVSVSSGIPAHVTNYGEPQDYRHYNSGHGRPHPLTQQMLARLDRWFLEACKIVGQRGVRMHAVYIGRTSRQYQLREVNLLEQCVDSAGGDPNARDVLVTPNANELDQAFKSLFAVNRRLQIDIVN